jgi:hypothetical protein
MSGKPTVEGTLRILNAVVDRALYDYAYGRQAFLKGGSRCLSTASFFLFGRGAGSLEGLCEATGLPLEISKVRARAVSLRRQEKDRLRGKKCVYLRKRWERYGRFRRARREGRTEWIFPGHRAA